MNVDMVQKQSQNMINCWTGVFKCVKNIVEHSVSVTIYAASWNGSWSFSSPKGTARTGMRPMHVGFPGGASDFSPESTFGALSCGFLAPPCAIACIYIWAHVKDPVSHVRVRWNMETLKHPACTVGMVFPWGKQPEFPLGEIPLGQCSCKKSTTTKKRRKKKKESKK